MQSLIQHEDLTLGSFPKKRALFPAVTAIAFALRKAPPPIRFDPQVQASSRFFSRGERGAFEDASCRDALQQTLNTGMIKRLDCACLCKSVQARPSDGLARGLPGGPAAPSRLNRLDKRWAG